MIAPCHFRKIRTLPEGMPGLPLLIFIPRKAGYCNHLRVSVCLFVCLFVSRISHKLLVGFRWNLVSREVMIIGRPSSNLGVIRIEIRIWDPDNCFPWTNGRILIVGKYSQSFSAVVVHIYIYTTYSDDDLHKGGGVVYMRVSGDGDCGFDPRW